MENKRKNRWQNFAIGFSVMCLIVNGTNALFVIPWNIPIDRKVTRTFPADGNMSR